jgi:uncharacterized iron-regulated membrane protein
MPLGAVPDSAYYPRNPEQAFMFSYLEPGVAADKADAINVFVDPYSARVTGNRVFYDGDSYFDNSLIGFIFKLHYALLWKEEGVILVGIVGVLLVVSVLTGLIVWWPLTGLWLKALTIKRRSSFERFNFDLHKTVGFYSMLILLAVLISGVYMNLPEQIVWLVELFSPVTRSEKIRSTDAFDRPAIDPGKAMSVVQTQYPGGKVHFLSLPVEKEGAFQICSDGVPELSRYVVNSRCVFVDQYTGEILQVMDAANGSGGNLFLQWQWPLHSGQAFGMTGRILVFLSGLACPVLYVTGVIRWLQKRRAVRRDPKINPRGQNAR